MVKVIRNKKCQSRKWEPVCCNDFPNTTLREAFRKRQSPIEATSNTYI